MKSFSPHEVEVFVISNSEAVDADDMRALLAEMPHTTSRFLPLGRPAGALSGRGKLGKALAYVPSAMSLVRAAAFVRKHRIQIVHATDRPRDASYASLLGHMTGAISVVHMHAPVANLSGPTMWGMRNASAIFAVSESVRGNLIDLGLVASKIHTVHNAVDTDYFNPDVQHADQQAYRDRFGIPANVPVIGIAARMNPWKGQYELIAAVSRLRDIIPDLHLVILGTDVPEMRADYERRALQGGIAERVHFGGYQSDVRPFLRDIDLFVHPSYGEPFGLAIVEAMAMRKPVVACGTGGVPEIITHGVDGWLVEERSVDSVAAAISRLLGDRELCRQLGVRARQTVCERFTPLRQSAIVTRLYANLVAAA